MKLRIIAFFAATTLFAALGITVQTFAQKSENQIITFDINSFFTAARGINSAGEITGVYAKFFSTSDGFLRAPDGTITLFDCPGALIGTSPTAINSAGEITGNCSDSAGTHGFLRARDGNIATFDAPGSPIALGAGGTSPSSINAAGKITGSYINVRLDAVQHGFVRDSDGTIMSFDCPGAPGGTSPSSINAAGEITGNCSDAAGTHGFLRARDGNITTFDAPGALIGTFPTAINSAGEITGFFFIDPESFPRSFLRYADHHAESENELDEEIP